MGPLGVTGIRVVDSVVKWLEQRDLKSSFKTGLYANLKKITGAYIHTQSEEGSGKKDSICFGEVKQ